MSDKYSSSILTAAAATFAGFGATAAAEALVSLNGPGTTLFQSISIAVGLVSAVAALVFAPLALIIPAFFEVVTPIKGWARWVSPNGDEPASESSRIEFASRGLALIFAAAVFVVVSSLGGAIAHQFNQRLLTAAFVGLFSMGGLAVGWLVYLAVFRVMTGILTALCTEARLLGLPVVLTPFIIITAGAAIGIYSVASLDLGAWRLERFLWLASSVTTSFAIYRLAIAYRWVSIANFVLAGAALVVTTALFSTDLDWARSGRVVMARGGASQLSLTFLRTLLDGDGDGFSNALGGGDCDDQDPKVGPHAREIPGNGVDENCAGGDAPLPEKVTKATPLPQTKRVDPRPYNIVFILIDTLRPDRLGAYGYKRATSPNIDAWAKETLIFEGALSQAPNTPRSFPSILTGRYPSRIAWVKRNANYGKLRPENETLFELYANAGWRTEAVSNHWYFERAKGIKDGVHLWDNKGFLTIRESNRQSSAPQITAKMLKRLDVLTEQRKRFVLFAHYFDPHGSYVSHKKTKSFGKGLSNKYDGEIAFVDHHIGPVLERLSKADLDKNTIVILTSDHGEAFKEHGFYFHGRTVYNEETSVPMFIKIPGVAPQRVKTRAALIDILPTLAELTGIPAPLAQGESLVGLWTGKGPKPKAPVFSEQIPYPNYKKHIVSAVQRDGDFKVIRNITDNVTEVFNISSDPKESKNLLDQDPDSARQLRDKLERFIDGDPG